MSRGQIESPEQALAYALAGRAVLTLQSAKTGARYTYRISAPSKDSERGGRVVDRDANIRFVGVLTGPDNMTDYDYMGFVRDVGNSPRYQHGRKSRISATAPSAIAIEWTLRMLAQGRKPADLEIYHEGCCGRCGRVLTVPSSIESGFGPECIGKL